MIARTDTAFTELYQSTKSILYSYCRSICDNEYDAQDLMQDTYLRAWLRMSQLRNTDCTRRWLLSIAARIYSNSMRKKRPQLWSDEMLEAIPDTTQIPEAESEGNMMYRSLYGKTREEAEYKMLIAQQNTPDEYAVTEMTVKELTVEWFRSAQIRLKESTIANYRMKLEKHILPAFGEMQCCLLKAKAIYSLIEEKMKSGLSARYISDIIVLLKSIYRYASREYHIRNIMDGIILPKCQKSEPSMLSSEQQERLKSYISANQNLTTMGVAVSLYTGIRIGELCALQWGDIDLEKRLLTVRKTIQRVQIPDGNKRTKLVITAPKSSSSVREIPIPECLLGMLRQFQGHRDNYVLSGKNKPVEPRTMQYRFAKLLDNANLPSVHFHSLRHAFASGCIALGFDVKTLSEILGHSSIELTLNRYVHSSMERKRECMRLLSWSAA